ncbi:hypothetical protein NHX12_025843 [Muraenolepis orangiensis]|uniref:Hemimethylated DNA-binding domain-containing protein n=1 Tax=Muraenolepis orangiensis TaxID=630683 RepID=A0A9Q0EDZ6_9TELE|nr:hypothetical protein NHX12_025843 [Muraenolepis orangiensis]
MPQVAATTVLQLALLLSAIPAQYLISRWSGSTAAQRYHATTRLRRIWKDWSGSYLNGTAWREWAEHKTSTFREEGPGPGGTPEGWMLDNDQGYFGASRAVRSPRPPFVFLRVGEVVRERNGLMVGVVVGWDAELHAPPGWLSKRPSGPQTQLERVTGVELEIPTLEQYFTHFNGRQFVMRTWLREIYPEDEEDEDEEWPR